MNEWLAKYENPNRNEVKLILDVWGVRGDGRFIVIFAGCVLVVFAMLTTTAMVVVAKRKM